MVVADLTDHLHGCAGPRGSTGLVGAFAAGGDGQRTAEDRFPGGRPAGKLGGIVHIETSDDGNLNLLWTHHWAGRFPLDEGIVQINVLDCRAFTGDLALQHLHGLHAHLIGRKTHGGELRRTHRRIADVVAADDGNVLRDPKSLALDRVDRAERDQVVGSKHRSRPLAVQQVIHRGLSGLVGEAGALRDAGRETCPLHGLTVARGTQLRRADVLRTSDVRDPLMAHCNETVRDFLRELEMIYGDEITLSFGFHAVAEHERHGGLRQFADLLAAHLGSDENDPSHAVLDHAGDHGFLRSPVVIGVADDHGIAVLFGGVLHAACERREIWVRDVRNDQGNVVGPVADQAPCAQVRAIIQFFDRLLDAETKRFLDGIRLIDHTGYGGLGNSGPLGYI